ncbi:MAG: hypothetical protein IKX55_07205 [Bacteroidaceae bacterium]|nr:hypothetical protein [Bacteroidaceae bacterium]
MKRTPIISILAVSTALLISSCSREERFTVVSYGQETQTIFNISVAKNTKTKSEAKSTRSESCTKNISDYTSEKPDAYLASDIAFGLVGVDNRNMEVLVDNQPVYEKDGVRTANVVTSSFSSGSMKVSAFYPHVSSVSYHKDGSYAISFTPNDIKKGPLASNAVDMRCDQDFETVSLQFHHISNSVGFMVCDITDDDQLKGLMHVRKVIIHGMPAEGLYVVDGKNSHWVPNAKRQDIVIYEGNDLVKCGIENASFLAGASLSDNRENCEHHYVVPEEFKEGKHYVEVFFDVDEFDYEGTHYRGAKGKSQIIELSGVIPDDMMELGLQYTFVLGMNIYTVYRPIEFTANLNDYEVKFNGYVLDYDNE